MGNEDIDTVIQTNRHIGREIMEGDRDSEQTDRLTEVVKFRIGEVGN